MCGRFAFFRKKKEITDQLQPEIWDDVEAFQPSYNIAPTNLVPVLCNNEGRRAMHTMRWGLVPHWAKDDSMGAKLINARVETLDEKPSFRNLLGRQHCILAMDVYFEWQAKGGTKTPYMIGRKDGKLLLAAGLWDVWKMPDGRGLPTFTVITRPPISTLADIHNRMPLLIEDTQIDPWRGELSPVELIGGFESPLQLTEITNRINSVRNDGPACIQVAPKQLDLGL